MARWRAAGNRAIFRRIVIAVQQPEQRCGSGKGMFSIYGDAGRIRCLSPVRIKHFTFRTMRYLGRNRPRSCGGTGSIPCRQTDVKGRPLDRMGRVTESRGRS